MEAAVIEHEALRLSEAERAVLIEKLIESISPPDKKLREAWVMECDDRMRALENGQITLVSGDEAMRQARASLEA